MLIRLADILNNIHTHTICHEKKIKIQLNIRYQILLDTDVILILLLLFIDFYVKFLIIKSIDNSYYLLCNYINITVYYNIN